jgi:hypothetical protein
MLAVLATSRTVSPPPRRLDQACSIQNDDCGCRRIVAQASRPINAIKNALASCITVSGCSWILPEHALVLLNVGCIRREQNLIKQLLH